MSAQVFSLPAAGHDRHTVRDADRGAAPRVERWLVCGLVLATVAQAALYVWSWLS